MRKPPFSALVTSGVLAAALAVFPQLTAVGEVNFAPRAAVDLDHPGETTTISATFRMNWRSTANEALQGIDDLVAEGTHGITPVQMSTVAADGNRTLTWKSGCPSSNDAVSDLDADVRVGAWCFDGDDAYNEWYPQGVSTSRTSTLDGVLLSWYHKAADGSTDMTRITVGPRPLVQESGSYRIILLAVPTMTPTGLTISDLRLHAGGIAVDGNHLYVTDSVDGGFRVFDLTKVYRVTTGKSTLGLDATDGMFYAHGAKYILFEQGRYAYDTSAGQCKASTVPPDSQSRNLCFSTVSVDRSYPTPGLVSTEYRRAAGLIDGRPVRVVRWPLNANGTLTADAAGTVTSTTVYGTYTPRIQGVAAHYDSTQKTTVYYNTSLTLDGVVQTGTIYSDRGGRDAWQTTGPRGGESFGFDPYSGGDRFWSVTEHPNLRMMFWVYRDEMQPAGDS